MALPGAVAEFFAAGFKEAHSRWPELHEDWVALSVRVGGLLPHSSLMSSIQAVGDLDLALRCMEDDRAPTLSLEPQEIYHDHYHKMLAELWVTSVYETLRLVHSRM